MRRREFICLIGGSVTAWPLFARAQNAARMARIGYLTLHPPGAEEAAFTEGLNDLGWTEGRNIKIDRRICSGDMGCLEKSAVELAALKLDVIVAVATLGVQAVRNRRSSRSGLRCQPGKTGRPHHGYLVRCRSRDNHQAASTDPRRRSQRLAHRSVVEFRRAVHSYVLEICAGGGAGLAREP
jgi:hypothetical protein